MKKDFHFEEIGKQTPYLTPEGFFERVQKTVLAQTVEKEEENRYSLKPLQPSAKTQKRQRTLRAIIITALSVAALIGGILFFTLHTSDHKEATTGTLLVANKGVNGHAEAWEQYVQSLTDEELVEWVQSSENDIFMDFSEQ